jgi:Ca2+-dependent lipid-binding protein
MLSFIFSVKTKILLGLDGEFTISCYDWDRDGTHDLIGRSVVNLRELLLGPVQLALRDPERENQYDQQNTYLYTHKSERAKIREKKQKELIGALRVAVI